MRASPICSTAAMAMKGSSHASFWSQTLASELKESVCASSSYTSPAMDGNDMISLLSTNSPGSSSSTPRRTSVCTRTTYPTAPSGPPSISPMTSMVCACLSAHHWNPLGERTAQWRSTLSCSAKSQSSAREPAFMSILLISERGGA